MRILVVGGGGREHALCWALRRDAPDATLFAAPGNPGIAQLATTLAVQPTDLAALEHAARARNVDLVVVGPEAPLAAGLVDGLRARGIPAFGPTAAAARIEASKAFAKDLMNAAGVPTARSRTVRTMAEARTWIDSQPEPLVVKASGLAAGKGAVVCAGREDARAAAAEMLEGGRFGDAGREVIIEEFLEGEEISLLALADGERAILLPACQDHKRLGEGDTGPNTGGMGAYTPVSRATPEVLEAARRDILDPTLRALAEHGTPYRGVLYAGLMIQPDGRPAVIEFNCRFGDPEAQAVLPAIDPGLLDCLVAIAEQRAVPRPDDFAARRAAVVTVLAARGYPEAPARGDVIDIPPDLGPGVIVFHAGTARNDAGRLVAAGGRVLNVVGTGPDVVTAARRSREAAVRVAFEHKTFRSDIAWRELARAGAA